MTTVNRRDWTPIESDPRWEKEGYFEKVKAEADGLARWWSQIHHEAEQRGFARRREIDDGYYDEGEYAPMRRDYDRGPQGEAEYQLEVAAFEEQRKEADDAKAAAAELERAQVEFIEERLARLGARMMRPYEHWNEDERLVEYMERDR